MTALWWLALPVLLLPIWWHRQRRRPVQATPLATARFLPKSVPRQRRAWRWVDLILLLLRCLLLATVIAWLADPVIAWRGDTVLVVPGGVSKDADAIQVPTQDAIGWFRVREAEWTPEAKIVIVGPQTMAATRPYLTHQVTLQTVTPPAATGTRHIAIFSDRPASWQAMFAAVDGPIRYVVDAVPGAQTEWIVWDRTGVPPPAAPWRVVEAGLPADAPGARTLLETWQRLYYPPVPYVAPPQVLAAAPYASVQRRSGALRDKLLMALIALFALERGLAHVRKR
jgi:hypothetical protein